jgi:nucleotide-binding universal stress UspA family protein
VEIILKKVCIMNILLAMDNSRSSHVALREVLRRPWPPDTEVRVLSVAHALPFVPDPTLTGVGLHYYSLDQAQKHAVHAVSAAVRELTALAPDLHVTSVVLDGAPSAQIVEEAQRCGADLIVLGSHDHGAAVQMLLGSVSRRVVLDAPCSVEVIRGRTRRARSLRLRRGHEAKGR